MFFSEFWNSDLEGNVCERLMSTRNKLYTARGKKSQNIIRNDYQTEQCGTGIDVNNN
jgi:hypothetical protein